MTGTYFADNHDIFCYTVSSWQHYINGEGANLTLSIADFDMSEDLFDDPGKRFEAHNIWQAVQS